MKRLLILVLVSLVIPGCGPRAPARPSTDPCLALHTQGHPDCRPWTPVPGPTPTTHRPNDETIEAPVIEVVDVDMIKVRIDDTVYSVRYAGIDCTDTKQPSDPQAGLRSAATEANKALVEGQTVLLTQGALNKDQDGRLLRYVHVGETFVNLELIELGFARESLHPGDRRYASIFREAQKMARKQKLGLWSATLTP